LWNQGLLILIVFSWFDKGWPWCLFWWWKANEEEQALKSGPLKPGVETVEGTVRSVVGPVYDKFHDVPIEVLKFVDRKVTIVLVL